MTVIKIGVVDDHPLFREGVTRSLSETKDFVVVGQGATADDAVAIASGCRPDVLLLDVSMPGDGLSAIEAVLAASANTKVLMLTASETLDSLVGAMQRGASGYVLKGVGSRGLVDAIRTIHAGSKYVTPAMSAKFVEQSFTEGGQRKVALTPRERDVMELVAQGLSNKHIGLKLDLQEKTVKHHMTQILTKLGVSNRTEAALAWRDVNGAHTAPTDEYRLMSPAG
ncbi:response regulator [Pararhizobium arenae]|uniref:response regulator n=1 Tax=Pararhizobium arenae TaxID=1856850 RepID=UPI00094A9CC2|nr:response regulator transcription factor [Pararhizobium arenae]